jgi:exonuclease SbcC
MRLRSVTFRGRVDAFLGPDPVTIDLDAVGDGLIALVGSNGSGKTSCLEAAPTALYKTFPSRPGWYEGWEGTNAFVEAIFDDGGDELKVRVQVDAEHRTTEAYLFVNGASLTTGRAAEFETEIGRRFGSLDLFLASVFSSQSKDGSFLRAKKSQRKELVIEMLRLAMLQVMSEIAGEHRGETTRTLETAQAKERELMLELHALPEQLALLENATLLVDSAGTALVAARAEETAALSALERAKAAAGKREALRAAEASASRELDRAERAKQAAVLRGANVEKDFQRKLRFLGETDVEKLKEPIRRRHAETMERLAKRRERLEAALADVPDAAAARQELEELADQRTYYEDQRKELEDLRRRSAAATNAVVLAEQKLQAATEALRREVERLTRQAALMEQAPCTEAPRWDPELAPPATGTVRRQDGRGIADLAGTCPLLADARGARGGLEVLSNEGILYEKQRVAERTREASDLQNLLTFKEAQESPERGLSILAVRERELNAWIAKAEAASTAREQLASLVEEATDAQATLAREMQEAATKAGTATEQLAAAQAERDAALQDAEVELEAATESLRIAAEAYGPAHRALKDAERDEDTSGVASAHALASQTRAKAEQALREADIARAGIQARVAQLQEKGKVMGDLRARVADLQMHLGDWSLLERALGKDGVQALEIDAAGPEVVAIINALLADWPGDNRYCVAFETLREKKSARGEYTESFDVRVTHNGREKQVEALSGGQGVVIDTAVRLAFAIFNVRKAGVRWETLWLDEAAGALDPDNAMAYVSMLRRARELGAFRQVIFVSHSQEVWEAADARLFVADGRITTTLQREAA